MLSPSIIQEPFIQVRMPLPRYYDLGFPLNFAGSIAKLGNGSSPSNVTSYTTASISVTSGRLLIAHVITDKSGSGVPAVPTISNTGTALTWAKRSDNALGGSDRHVVWTAWTGTTESMTVTFDWGAETQNEGCWQVHEGSGLDSSGTVVQVDVSTGDSDTPAGTLAAFADATNNLVIVLYGSNNDSTWTAPTGYTDLGSEQETDMVASAWDTGEDLTPSATTSTAEPWAFCSMELKAAAVGGTVYTRAIDESIDVNDLTFRDAKLFRELDSILNMTDALAPFAIRNRVTLDNFSLSEELKRFVNANRVTVDDIEVTDALTRLALFYRELQDNIDLSDTVTSTVIEPGGDIVIRAIQDNINLSDVIERVVLANRTLQDDANITDDLIVQRQIFRIVADSLLLSDEIVRALIRNRGIDETIAVTDTVIRNALLNRIIIETLGITDDLTTSINYAAQAIALIVTAIEASTIETGIADDTIITGAEDTGADTDVT